MKKQVKKKRGKVMSENKKPKTRVLLLLDRSGSMGSIRTQTVVWFNEQVQHLKEKAKDQDIEVSLITFNHDVFEHLNRKSAEELFEATDVSYVPNGGTSLRDAMGYAIDKAMSEDEPEISYLLIVISDGEDLNSTKYSKAQIRELFQGIEATKRWSFNFVGCERDEIFEEIQKMTGVDAACMAKATYSNIGGASASNKKRMDKYFKARSMGYTNVQHFCSDQGGKMADYSQDDADADFAVKCAAMPAAPSSPFPNLSNPYVGSINVNTSQTSDVFAASMQNCVCSSGKTYTRPVWKA